MVVMHRLWVLATSVLAAGCGRGGFDPIVDATQVPCSERTFATPPMSSHVDRFDTGVLDDQYFHTACITQVGGELVAAPRAGQEAADYCLVFTRTTYHLTCDSVSLQLTESVAPELGVQTVMYIGNTDDQVVHIVVERGGIAMEEAPAGPLDLTNGGWWRLRETGGTLHFDTAPDGIAWEQRAEIPTPFSLDDAQISLGAGTYKAVAGPGRARFRCLNTGPGC
jgi:hypothetical protein